MDLSHLEALRTRLSHEVARRDSAKNAKERGFREHQVAMCEKEIAGEIKFLEARHGRLSAHVRDNTAAEMSDDELLAELGDIGATLGL